MNRVTWIFLGLMATLTLVMTWIANTQGQRSLLRHQRKHASVGVFHSGEMATMNGISGQVTVETSEAPRDHWTIAVTLTDQAGAPITDAELWGHGVHEGTYRPEFHIGPAWNEPGRYTGYIPRQDELTQVMVHVDRPGGIMDEWIAEWRLPTWSYPGFPGPGSLEGDRIP